jgi:hypothetical protein
MTAPKTPGTAQSAQTQQILLIDGRFHRGINWFYWIAGLSLINTIASVAGATFAFIIGLGATQFVDAAVSGMTEGLGADGTVIRVIGFIFDIAMAGAFVVFGLLGTARKHRVIVTGMALYALDAVILLFLQDYVGAAFHGWALLRIFGGLRALGQLEALEEAPGGETVDAIRERLPDAQMGSTPQSLRLRLILIGILGLIATFFFFTRLMGNQ